MLKKKHYDAIGEILKRNMLEEPNSSIVITRIAIETAEYFEKENPMFQKDRFLQGCGLSNDR